MTPNEFIKSKIRTIPDFPKKGIMFRDITTLLADSKGFKTVIDQLTERYSKMDIDAVAGIEARGFIIGGALAYNLGKGFIPARKSGKLPFTTVFHEYKLEYGTDRIEMHTDALKQGEKILVIDDLLATGGTSIAAAKLIEKLGGEIVELAFIVDLPEVGGRKAIKDAGYKMHNLCEFEGE
jgi:adenine phosphoribosyltransferase